MVIAYKLLTYFLIFLFQFFLWTMLVYLMHRVAHIKRRYNPFHWIHMAHHRINYWKPENRVFRWYYFLFFFGSIQATIDVVLILTIPAVTVCLIYPATGVYILVFHYIYEVFFSEGVLDHNPRIKGTVTRFFAWGDYHLWHHKNWKYNYGLMITLWDSIFGTKHKI